MERNFSLPLPDGYCGNLDPNLTQLYYLMVTSTTREKTEEETIANVR